VKNSDNVLAAIPIPVNHPTHINLGYPHYRTEKIWRLKMVGEFKQPAYGWDI